MAVAIHPVTMPKWGIEMVQGTLNQWSVAQGARVDKGDPLLEVETDKIVNTVESPAAGCVRRIVAEAGPLRWWALLSPQGKVQAEGLVGWADGAFWLDADASVADGFFKRMRMYKLRAQLEIEDLRGSHRVGWTDEPEDGGEADGPPCAACPPATLRQAGLRTGHGFQVVWRRIHAALASASYTGVESNGPLRHLSR